MTEHLSSIVFSLSARKEESPFRRFLRHFDWLLFSDVLALVLLGLAVIYSASSRFGHPEYYVGKQMMAMLAGMTLLFLLATLNYQIFSEHGKAVFGLSVSLLLLVLAAGTTYRGTKAWIVLGPFAFQPSELSKLLVILVLSGWCARNAGEIKRAKSLIVPFAIVMSHVGLILMQPDFGSTLVYFPILLGVLFVAGARLTHLLAILFYGLAAGCILLLHTVLALSPEFLEGHKLRQFLFRALSFSKEFALLLLALGGALAFVWWLMRELRFRVHGLYFLVAFLILACGWATGSAAANSLMDYQRKRLLVFFKPGIDPLGAGYHVIQSVVALGSGKIFGKGFRSGTQTRLGFLPEQHTDFIFSVLGEEFGFAVSGGVILLYLMVVWRSITIAGDARDRFGSMVAVGIGCMFAFYGLLNLAMVMGLAPVTGLPLPFLSYGGSSLISSLAGVGILLSIHLRRYTH